MVTQFCEFWKFQHHSHLPTFNCLQYFQFSVFLWSSSSDHNVSVSPDNRNPFQLYCGHVCISWIWLSVAAGRTNTTEFDRPNIQKVGGCYGCDSNRDPYLGSNTNISLWKRLSRWAITSWGHDVALSTEFFVGYFCATSLDVNQLPQILLLHSTL